MATRNSWIQDLIVVASAEREVQNIETSEQWLKFIFAVYNDLFDLHGNAAIFGVEQSSNSLSLHIVDHTLTFSYDTQANMIGVISTIIDGATQKMGDIELETKLFLYSKKKKLVKCNRPLLEKMATDIFKPIVEQTKEKPYSFYEY